MLLIVATIAQAQVGIGTETPNASAILDVSSTTRGLLFPRMTTTQRDAIASPSAGLVIFNTTSNCLNMFTGAIWNELCGTATQGLVATLSCTPTDNGTLTANTAASSVSSVFSYTGGNNLTHNGQTVTSIGVTGLTATLSSGTMSSAGGTLTYNITGTPSGSGTASFAINIGGQTCTLSRTVAAAATNVTCLQTATTVVDVTNATTGKVWMDRNLGAHRAAISFDDSFAYGDYYQWGRPADGHQCRTSNTTTTQSSTNQPSHGNFILAGMSHWRSSTSTVLWDGVSGVNNPCPTGYRIPTQAEYQAEVSSWGAQQNRAGGYTSPLKLTTAGGRNHSSPGQIFQAGVNGFYWQSTTTSGSPISTNIRDTSVQTSGTQTTSSVGYSVRCIKN